MAWLVAGEPYAAIHFQPAATVSVLAQPHMVRGALPEGQSFGLPMST